MSKVMVADMKGGGIFLVEGGKDWEEAHQELHRLGYIVLYHVGDDEPPKEEKK